MALSVERLSHRFGRQQALDDVSLRVEPGDCYGFIGHNGAGKTTAMRVMLGLLSPDGGRVLVDGFDAARYPREARARMSGLIETPGFHGHWSGRRNLALLDGLGGGESDLDALLDMVGLSGVGKKPVRAYSQGMRQRLGVAQALLGDPFYVLLDEPTNGLDPDGIREMRELVLRLTREENKTVFISSHQLQELAGICNRVGLLRQGRLIVEGSLEDLLAGDAYTLTTAEGERAVDLDGKSPSDVLRGLVDEGIEVVSFAPRTPTLEEVYHREEPTASSMHTDPPSSVGAPKEHRAPAMPVLRMVRHELRRWTSQFTVPLMLALPVVAGLVVMFFRRSSALGHAEEVDQGTLFSTTAVNAYEAVAMSMHIGVWLLCYVLLGLASQSIAGELAGGTLRNVLLRPLTRVQVAVGKALALLGVALVAYLVLVGASVAAAAAAFDFTGVTEILPNGRPYVSVKAEEIAPEFWRALRSPLLPLAGYVGLGFLAGALVRRSAAALALALGAGVLLDLVRDLDRAREAWFLPAYVPSLGRSSFVDFFLLVAQGYNDAVYTLTESELSVPLLWTAASLVGAVVLFRRRYVP